MPAAKHTSGPWISDDLAIFADREGAYAIRLADVMPEEGCGLTEAEMEANAILMAAAPEMLEALKSLISMYERGYVAGTAPDVGEAFCSGIHEARAAIAKVEGD